MPITANCLKWRDSGKMKVRAFNLLLCVRTSKCNKTPPAAICKPLGVILWRQCKFEATLLKLTFNATFTTEKFDRIE